MSDVENYPSNSHKNKPKEKKVEQVVSGQVIQRKKTLGGKIKETFTGEAASSVAEYVLFDVIVPAAKAMLADAASQGAERLLFGDSRERRVVSGGRQSYTPYNRVSSSSSKTEYNSRRNMSYRARATHNFDEIVLDSRGEAEEVLDRLADLIRDYDVATVADLYDLVGITGSFTDDKWGWFDIRSASVSRVREGYLLNLPKTEPVD